jgi:hypothetical protein
MSLALAALLLLDPLGDDAGAGYHYPSAAIYQEKGFADLVSFGTQDVRGQLILEIKLKAGAEIPEPAVVLVFVDAAPGGERQLGDSGFTTPAGKGWEWAYLVNAWDATERSAGGEEKSLSRSLGQDSTLIATGRPFANHYRFYIMSGLYDPFSEWQLRPIPPGGGIWSLDGPAEAPRAVDVIANNQPLAYAQKVLPPAGETHSGTQARLALAVSLLGAGTIALAFLVFR